MLPALLVVRSAASSRSWGMARPALAAALLALAGCTAVPALVQCRMAEASLRAAEAQAEHGAEAQAEHAPEGTYDLTLARVYLAKAREESSEAHYGLAIQLAKSSREASERVRATLASLRVQPEEPAKSKRGRL